MFSYLESWASLCCDELNTLIIADAIKHSHDGVTWDSIISFIVTVIIGLIAAGITYYSFKKSYTRERRSELIAMLDTLLNIPTTYPYLEDKLFIKRWTSGSENEKDLRYDNYCFIVFNFLERLWNLFNGNKKEMLAIVNYYEFIDLHKKWWIENLSENKRGYSEKFYNFIANIVNNKD